MATDCILLYKRYVLFALMDFFLDIADVSPFIPADLLVVSHCFGLVYLLPIVALVIAFRACP